MISPQMQWIPFSSVMPWHGEARRDRVNLHLGALGQGSCQTSQRFRCLGRGYEVPVLFQNGQGQLGRWDWKGTNGTKCAPKLCWNRTSGFSEPLSTKATRVFLARLPCLTAGNTEIALKVMKPLQVNIGTVPSRYSRKGIVYLQNYLESVLQLRKYS